MDSECERLVEEMWQSYLCEENMDSFYEQSTTIPYFNNIQLESGVFSLDSMDPSNMVFGNDLTEVQSGWDPLENLFELLEEIILFEDGHEGECPFCHHSNADTKTGCQASKNQVSEKSTTGNVKSAVNTKRKAEDTVMNSKNETPALKKHKKRSSKKTLDHNNGKQKRKTADK